MGDQSIIRSGILLHNPGPGAGIGAQLLIYDLGTASLSTQHTVFTSAQHIHGLSTAPVGGSADSSVLVVYGGRELQVRVSGARGACLLTCATASRCAGAAAAPERGSGLSAAAAAAALAATLVPGRRLGCQRQACQARGVLGQQRSSRVQHRLHAQCSRRAGVCVRGACRAFRMHSHLTGLCLQAQLGIRLLLEAQCSVQQDNYSMALRLPDQVGVPEAFSRLAQTLPEKPGLCRLAERAWLQLARPTLLSWSGQCHWRVPLAVLSPPGCSVRLCCGSRVSTASYTGKLLVVAAPALGKACMVLETN